MEDSVFWDSSLAFLCSQLDHYREMHEKANKDKPKNKKKAEYSERTEKQSLKALSPQEIAEIRKKHGRG